MNRRDTFVPVNGLQLHLTEWGPADGHPIVMLHGIRGYAETFAQLAAQLQPQWRVIAFDQRGRGQSDWDPQHRYYTSDYVADLEAVVAHLELNKFALLGHSMGGINAIVYASQHPDRVTQLIVEDAGPGAFESSLGAARIRRELASTPATFASWEAASEYMRQLRPSVSESARQQRLQNMLKPSGDGSHTWRYDHAGIAQTRLNPAPAEVVDLAPHIPRLACPTLVLRGGRSDYLQPEMADGMAAANPLLQWVQIDDAGHYIHDDQPALVAQLVRDFLIAELRT